MNDYIKLDIGKIVIINENNVKVFLRDEKHSLEKLNEADTKYVENLFIDKFGYNYYSEFLHTTINSEAYNDDTGLMDYYLKWLEKVIPVNCHENLYRNLKTLQLDQTNLNEKNIHFPGEYNINSNKITINNKLLKNIAKKETDDDKECFANYYNQILAHELCHMASSNYDEENNKAVCGFNNHLLEKEPNSNRGLTEGLTELLSFIVTPDSKELSSPYYIEMSFVRQLIHIIGLEKVLISYFSNQGLELMENELNELLNDKIKSYVLFRRIEDNFLLKQFDVPQSYIGNIQSSLIDYLIRKIDLQKESENFDINKTFELLETYEKKILTPEMIVEIGKDTNNYEGLYESVEKYYIYKKEFMEKYAI